MGLFLFGKSKGKSKRKSAAKPKRNWATGSKAETRSTMRLARPLLVMLLVGGMAVGFYYGRDFLMRQIATQQARAVQVDLVDVPVWLGEARAQQITEAIAAVIDPDPLNRDSLDRAAELLRDNPWIDHVDRIERDFNNRVVVHLSYREPVALIGARDGFHLVDGEGRRLPGVYPYDQVETLGLPAITGVRAAPPAEGHAWTGYDVKAGLKLAKLLSQSRWAAQVRAVDVANYDGRADRSYPHLSIITRQGTVRWGRAPGDEGVYEPDVSQKLAMLQRIADSYAGSIDAGGRVVDVFLDSPMIHSATSVRYTSMP